MDRLEAMSIVLLAAEKGSLTAAAKTLNMPLPTVSRKLSELETYLGTKLLQRSTRKLTLTETGEKYVSSAKKIMELIAEVERSASGEFTTPRGELVITAPVLFGQMYMLPIVTEVLASFPDINIRLILSDHVLHLQDESVDMAVRLGELPDSSMKATRVGMMDTVVCASPELISSRGKPKHPRDLQKLPCVIFAGPATTTWNFRKPGSKREFPVNITSRLSVTTAEAAVQATLRGTGFTRIYRYHCSEALRTKKLIQVLKEFDVEPLPVHLVYAEQGPLPLKMRVFLDYTATQLRASLSKLK
jgi:DNA-binding transcriptional LysR family regulator